MRRSRRGAWWVGSHRGWRGWPGLMAALMIGAGGGALAGPAAAFGQPAPVTPGTPGASTTPAGRAVPVRPIPPGIFAGSLREDAVASAQPTAEQPDVTDTQSADLTMISPGKANTVATGSATCDGCAPCQQRGCVVN